MHCLAAVENENRDCEDGHLVVDKSTPYAENDKIKWTCNKCKVHVNPDADPLVSLA